MRQPVYLQEGDGFKIAMWALDGGRVNIGACRCGPGKLRIVRGAVPAGSGIKFKASDGLPNRAYIASSALRPQPPIKPALALTIPSVLAASVAPSFAWTRRGSTRSSGSSLAAPSPTSRQRSSSLQTWPRSCRCGQGAEWRFGKGWGWGWGSWLNVVSVGEHVSSYLALWPAAT